MTVFSQTNCSIAATRSVAVIPPQRKQLILPPLVCLVLSYVRLAPLDQPYGHSYREAVGWSKPHRVIPEHRTEAVVFVGIVRCDL